MGDFLQQRIGQGDAIANVVQLAFDAEDRDSLSVF